MNNINPSEQLPDRPDKATILAVVQLLRKYGLKVNKEKPGFIRLIIL